LTCKDQKWHGSKTGVFLGCQPRPHPKGTGSQRPQNFRPLPKPIQFDPEARATEFDTLTCGEWYVWKGRVLGDQPRYRHMGWGPNTRKII